MEKKTIIMAPDRETKNTIRFGEQNNGTTLGMIYIPKATLEELDWGKGEKVQITLEVVEE